MLISGLLIKIIRDNTVPEIANGLRYQQIPHKNNGGWINLTNVTKNQLCWVVYSLYLIGYLYGKMKVSCYFIVFFVHRWNTPNWTEHTDRVGGRCRPTLSADFTRRRSGGPGVWLSAGMRFEDFGYANECYKSSMTSNLIICWWSC